MLHLKHLEIFNKPFSELPEGKLLITTLNAHSYNIAKEDHIFFEATSKSHVVLPDGISIVWAKRILNNEKISKIAGYDLFYFEMERLQETGGKAFFLGSTTETLDKISVKVKDDFPDVQFASYSPPLKCEFDADDSDLMVEAVNAFSPDVLFIAMTAPKQEKWAYQHFDRLQAKHVCCIGAVFDFYAGTIKRAPRWMINLGYEWFYRFYREPKRMWRRYLLGNTKFILGVFKEKLKR
jgi:N-acetylglucosaminyldiphosphoundecaprenol N-acetyl-beta-D-mannosaminyltransferase